MSTQYQGQIPAEKKSELSNHQILKIKPNCFKKSISPTIVVDIRFLKLRQLWVMMHSSTPIHLKCHRGKQLIATMDTRAPNPLFFLKHYLWNNIWLVAVS